ncbi:hypothetical protein KAFR_0D02240 [Kazachstania africana CBS 2517]|uniref:histidine kinase n=1 Tax=Kazachstania africana (strain ATCC 22294 / BCRC 22015 / CBS 2517 / CECT 1963 / NBRC 1671 / NRRL Y-8276) TaxID=1071382 RepID=H2AU21_KAZAF|nr:hypothetical protein KAFR_0D02240 [Kazachstania africana CBS 2517]CCF57871.1 hypothetical protein KAFR_0D02240 [Kazachstania africana CBS 2517]
MVARVFARKRISQRLKRLAHLNTKPPYRISIRTQLIAVVSLVAILSLLILAVTTGVYFTSSYKNLRANRLYIAAQLKSSQIDQTLTYLYYQSYWISTRDTLQDSLANFVAGNKSSSNWESTESVLEKFLSSSDYFSAVKVYDENFDTVLSVTNNGTGNQIAADVLEKLFPLSTNIPLSSSLETTGILTDPVLNGTSYLMSMSLPVFANPSIILSTSRVYGYITIIMTADGLLSVFNDTTAIEKSNVAIVSAVYNNQSELDAYHLALPPYGFTASVTDINFQLKNSSFLNGALKQGKGGSIKKTHFLYNKAVAVGYSPCSFELANWVSVVSQAESVFSGPSTKLTKIIAGVVVGISVFVMLVTLPLAYFAVKPIVRLKKATEIITEGRGLRPTTPGSGSVSRTSSMRREKSPRTSIVSSRKSTATGNSNSLNENSASLSSHPMVLTSENVLVTNHSGLSRIPVNMNQELLDRASASTVNTLTIDSNDRLSERSKHLITFTNLTEARVPIARKLFFDELSDLTETFNTMTDALDEHYTLLEDRVRARTKQLEAAKIQAEAANEAKTVFIANISHELRTPLNGILGMTAISMEEEDITKIRSSLKLIFRSGELLLHILTELLTFSKNVLQRTKLEKRNFCITDVALQMKSIFGKVAKDQHVRLSIILSPNIMRTMVLYGDSNRIIQVVMNLVSNALKFTPVDGKVQVKIKLLGEYDEESSKNSKFEKVYVKGGTEFTSIPAELAALSKRESTAGSHFSGSSSHIKEKLDGIPANVFASDSDSDDPSEGTTINTSQQRTSSNEDYVDNISIASTSTSSYDDAIFNSQFKKTPDLYEDEDGNLGEELSQQKTWVFRIEVIDTGPGIDSSLQESVFEPFVQGDQTLSRQYGGTGLGLSICRQLATMMNGTMTLESTVGSGSKFIFTVPLTQTRVIKLDESEHPYEDEFNPKSKMNRKVKFNVARSINSRRSRSSLITSNSSRIATVREESRLETRSNHSDVSTSNKNESASPQPESGSNLNLDRPFLQSTGTAISSANVPTVATLGKTLNVLVAEDNHVNQEVIKRMLSLEGVKNIDLACDGQDAFDNVKSLKERGEFYDMIFMDVQMPKVDGLSATKMIRNDLKYEHPIVALTAFADDSNIKECLDAGMDGFLSKPIKRPQLKTILLEYCPKVDSMGRATSTGEESKHTKSN